MKIRALIKPPIEELKNDPGHVGRWWKDYDMVAKWWKYHGWDSVPAHILPALGVIVHDGDRDLVAAWLYMDNSVGVCMMEWLVSSPNAKPRETIKGVRLIIEFLREEAKELGYGVMLTTCKQKLLSRLYEKNGFVKTDEGMTHMLQNLYSEEGE